MSVLVSTVLNGLKPSWRENISNLDPTDSVFTGMTREESVTQTYYNWQTDHYAAVNLNNARPEGNDPTEDNGASTQVLTTNLQHMDETVKVSDVADKIGKYGRAKELTYRIFKKTAELKRSREAIMLGGQVTDGTTTTPLMGSFQSQVDASLRIATGDATKSPTEDQLVSTLESMYTKGAKPTVIMVSPSYAIDIAKFDRAAGRYRNIEDSKKIVNCVNLYVSPFGEQRVVLNLFSLATDTFIFDPKKWTKLCLFPWTTQELGKTGRNNKVQIYGTYGLAHDNPIASAVIRQTAGTLGADGIYRF